jgi:hypothetical protein
MNSKTNVSNMLEFNEKINLKNLKSYKNKNNIKPNLLQYVRLKYV